MALENITSKLTQYFSWLHYWQWEEWGLLTIAIVALALLILLVRAHQKVEANTKRFIERSPIVGVKSADHKLSRQQIVRLERVSFARVPERHGRQKKPTEITRQLEKSNEQLKQLQHEAAKCRETEERLERQIAELTAANEQLRHKVAESKRTQERLRQPIAELTAANRQLQREKFERARSEKAPTEDAEQESKS
jgi:septal ring factor EnvC (AmiA/AmiB activator)